jgi:hypothetical protein
VWARTLRLFTAAALALGVIPAFAAPAAAASSCAVCVSFVTTHKGPLGTTTTKLHKDLLILVPYVLDVDGPLPPLPIGILPVAPGYDVRVTVTALDAAKPKITIEKLLLSAAVMPLRIELVQASGSGWLSLGYDALDSSAPQSWVANVDTSNRDQKPETTQARIDVTTKGAAKTLTILNEEFAGDPVGTRTNRSIRRMQFVGDGAATVVPRNAVADLTTYDNPTSDESSQRLVLTHTDRTTMKFDVVQPSGARTTGTLAELPSAVDLTLRGIDLNGDGQLDKTIDYSASAVVELAEITTQTKLQTTALSVEGLPTPATLKYTSRPTDAAVTAGAPDKTKVEYAAGGRARRMVITTDDTKRKIVADVKNLPTNIYELSATKIKGSATVAPGGVMRYRADTRTDSVKVVVDDVATATAGPAHAELTVVDVPSEISLDYAATSSAGTAHYAASGDPALRADALIIDGQGQQLTIGVDKIPSDILVDFKRPSSSSSDPTTFDYTASAVVPNVEIHGTNLKGSSRIKQFHLTLKDVPTRLSLRKSAVETSAVISRKLLPPPEACNKAKTPGEDRPYCLDDDVENDVFIRLYETTTLSTSSKEFTITTPDAGELGLGEIQLTSGPDTRLPATGALFLPLDGLLVHDVANDFVVFARVAQFDSAEYKTISENQHVDGPGLPCCDYAHEHMHAGLFTSSGHQFVLDAQKDERGAVKKTLAQLASLPANIAFDTDTEQRLNSTTGEEEWSQSRMAWNATSTVNGISTGVDQYVAAFRLDESLVAGSTTTVTKWAYIDPMPATFEACQTFNTCSYGVFDESLDKLHNGVGPWRWIKCFPGCPSDFLIPFPSSKTDFTQTSVRLNASVPVNMSYFSGNSVAGQVSGKYTSVNVQGLRQFVLQGDQVKYGCDLDLVECKYGYLGIDTGGESFSGRIVSQADSGYTEFNFPAGFQAKGLVFAFHKTGYVSGYIGEAGELTCPSGTGVIVKGETLDDRFCNGNILEGTVLD